MGEKRKWEVEFLKYNQFDEKDKIDQLKEKFNNKTITREEYDELKKKEKVFNNIFKVANINEFKNKLEDRRKEVIDEISKYEKFEKAQVEVLKLEREMNEIQKRIENFTVILKDKSLAEEQRNKAENSYYKLLKACDENNKKFHNANKIVIEGKGLKQDDLKKLKEEKQELNFKIGECNLAGKNLMKGYSWDSVRVASIERGKKFTANQKLSRKNENAKTATSKVEEFPMEEVSKKLMKDADEMADNGNKSALKKVFDGIKNRFSSKEKESNNEETALKKQSFFEKHFPTFTKMFKNIRAKFSYTDPNKQKNENKEMNNEVKENNTENIKREEFIDYLQRIAENGIYEVEEDKDERMKNARERLNQRKQEAYERETKKFGKEYAKKSLDNDGEER